MLLNIYLDSGDIYLPVAISNRHVHLSAKHLTALFGDKFELKPEKPLSQPGQYASEATVTLSGPKGIIEGVRILGPVRKDTQIEISVTDSYNLGLKPVIRISGDIEKTPGCKIIGPRGEVNLNYGVIVAARHLHISDKEAQLYNLKDGDIIKVKKTGIREMIYGEILVRVSPNFSLELHFDIDEANAAFIHNGALLKVVE